MLAEGAKPKKKKMDGIFVRAFGAFNNSMLFKNVLYLHQAFPRIKHAAQRTVAHFTLTQSQYHSYTWQHIYLCLLPVAKSTYYLFFNFGIVAYKIVLMSFFSGVVCL